MSNSSLKKDIYTKYLELLDEGLPPASIKENLLQEFDESFVEDIMITFDLLDESTSPFNTLTPSKESFTNILSQLPEKTVAEAPNTTPVETTSWFHAGSVYYKIAGSLAVIILIVLVTTNPTDPVDTETFDATQEMLTTNNEDAAFLSRTGEAPDTGATQLMVAEEAPFARSFEGDLNSIFTSLENDKETIDEFEEEDFNEISGDLDSITQE